jgi:hypothetical protein
MNDCCRGGRRRRRRQRQREEVLQGLISVDAKNRINV